MLTAKPISTISYNSQQFLMYTLKNLTDAKILQFWAFVPHKGEYDSTLDIQDKDHIHLYLEPNRRIDTVDLLDNFIEVDPNNTLPLKCIVFRSSVFADWLLYNLHDHDYLVTKFETKQYTYSLQDFFVSDKDTFQQMVFDVYHSSDTTLLPKLTNALQSGNTFQSLAQSGHIPIAKANQYIALRNLMKGV